MRTPSSFFARALAVVLLSSCAAHPTAVTTIGTPMTMPTTTSTTSTTSTTAPLVTVHVMQETAPPEPEPEPEPAPDPAPIEPAGSSSDVVQLIHDVFGALGDQATNVAHCESTLHPDARNGPNYGLFQINRVHAGQWADVIGRAFTDSWMDADANTRFARWLYDESGGWGPWSCRWAA